MSPRPALHNRAGSWLFLCELRLADGPKWSSCKALSGLEVWVCFGRLGCCVWGAMSDKPLSLGSPSAQYKKWWGPRSRYPG